MISSRTSRRLRGRFTSVALCAVVATAVGCGGPAADAPLWSADFETGSLSEFAAPPTQVPNAVQPTVENTTIAAGQRAGAFTLQGAQQATFLQPGMGKLASLTEGDDLWFAWYMRLDAGFPPTTTGFQILSEWKNAGGGTAPLAMVVGTDGTFKAEGGFSHPDGVRSSSAGLGEATRDKWIGWTWHIKFSTDTKRALVSIWRDDRELVKDWHPLGGTLYPARASNGTNPNQSEGPFSSWRIGYLRSADVHTAGTVYFDALRVGTSRDAVRLPPLAAP